MNTAYRVPKGKFAFADRFLTQESDDLDADHRDGRQFADHEHQDGQKIAVGQDTEVRGIAWDGGYGIRSVDVSADGGRTWAAAELGQDLGRFSFRTWRYRDAGRRRRASTRSWPAPPIARARRRPPN